MSAALLQLAVNFVEKLKIYIALHCIATMYRSHGLPVVHVRQQDVASVPVPDLVCQGGCSRKVIIGFQQMIHSPCQPAHPPGVCEGAGHGARADQDDLRRFLQDRSPRVSSVRECEVGCLLQCNAVLLGPPVRRPWCWRGWSPAPVSSTPSCPPSTTGQSLELQTIHRFHFGSHFTMLNRR